MPQSGNGAQELIRYERMVLIRRFEERSADLVRAGEMAGSVLHVCTGQEGIAAGVVEHRDANDVMLSTHRGTGHCIAWGADLHRLLAENFGRIGGYAGGFAGHMHVVDLEAGILGTNGVVGGGLPLAVGAGLARAERYPGSIAVAFFGDGASNTGAWHESLNLAAVWRAPVLFVCENNGFAEMTYSDALTAGAVAGRAAAFGIPVESVDGTDVADVAVAAGRLVTAIRADGGPALLECRAFRATGHWIGDPQHYREAEPDDEIAQRDPIARFEAADHLDAAARAGIREDVEARLDTVFDAVVAMERPTAEDFLTTRWARDAA